MEKYLRLYAESETAAMSGLVELLPGLGTWANVVVIPACNETPELLRLPPPCNGRSLLILVINESQAADQQVSLANQVLATTVESRFDTIWQSADDHVGFKLSLHKDYRHPRDILLVDRFSQGRKFPPKRGVGLARKIGVDLAAYLFFHQHIRSPFIHCTDGDVWLPETYFTCSNELLARNGSAANNYAALNYPFHHSKKLDTEPDKAESQQVLLATQLYELSLRYYVAGMKMAQSPYAFHTIGSTMAVNANHYAKVRGFPRREAGEDFYLLNKLAKVGVVFELQGGGDCQPIEIASRRSDRVPFGTGAAVNKITDMVEPAKEFRFYDPEVFEVLQLWLQSLPEIWKSQSTDLTLHIADNEARNAQRQALLAALENTKIEQILAHAFRQSSSLEQFTRQINTWFDAFRTLKLIHFLRGHGFPGISYITLESHQSFRRLLMLDKDLRTFCECLTTPSSINF